MTCTTLGVTMMPSHKPNRMLHHSPMLLTLWFPTPNHTSQRLLHRTQQPGHKQVRPLLTFL